MKISYYPGCTLKSKAKNLDQSALASLEALGVEVEELERWNCCGAVASLTDDDLIHIVGPVRNLVRAKEQGADKLVTLCSMCYNTLARANEIMKNDEEKRNTINLFMDEEIDYFGEVEVVHYLTLLDETVGWDKVRESVKKPLAGLNVGAYYGCTLQRPKEVGIEPLGSFELMGKMFESIGAKPVPFNEADTCCGSYQLLEAENGADRAATVVLNSAASAGIEALATSCPLCEFNLGQKQDALIGTAKIQNKVPVLYFTQLLAIALGVNEESCYLELNAPAVSELLKEKNLVSGN
ncbi:MAG: CoB--CoM heterodisulfide reductase iron-sulfur subunit B family protein [Desulfotalea sp.]